MLKNVFVPTDFSENADHALQYALNLAKTFELNIYVFNAHLASNQGAMMLSVDEVIKHERKAELEELFVKIRPQLDDDRISGHVAVVHSPIKAVCKEAVATDSQLIVMGTRGATGLKKIFLGSVASNVIRNTSLPVLTVPEKASTESPTHITLAIDSHEDIGNSILAPLTDLLAKTEAKFTIVYMQGEQDVDQSKGIFQFLDNSGISYDYQQLKGNDVEETLFKHIKDSNTDLLCMINHKRSFFQRLLHPSITQKVILDSKTPLLILHDAR